MLILYILTGILLLFSACFNLKKTFMALKIAWKKLINILPAFILTMIAVSIVLHFVPDTFISKSLQGGNKYLSSALASVLGSIVLMPGFVAYPLCGVLLKKGVSYMTISAFSVTLMMVGVLTLPIEKEYFGIKVALIRNIISFLIAVIISLAAGIIYREIF